MVDGIADPEMELHCIRGERKAGWEDSGRGGWRRPEGRMGGERKAGFAGSGRLDGRIPEGVVGGGRKAGREENARPDRCQEDRVVVQKADWKRRE